MIKYFDSSYRQKSSIFLMPFSGIRKRELHNPINTYLYCEAIEESILDYKLLILYKFSSTEMFDRWEQEVLLKNPLICNCYNTEEGNLYSLDLSDNKDLVDKFLDGKYTTFKEIDKITICKYHINGLDNTKRKITIDFFKDESNFLNNSNLSIPSSLYFKDLKHKVARDMVKEIYDTELESKRAIRDMDEICPIFDLEKETLKTQLCK